jgi:8-oxo-dGTP diphosphatase
MMALLNSCTCLAMYATPEVIIMDTDKPRHSVSVAGVITDDHDRVLLIQRADNGNWESPGGVLELNETIEDGLRREVCEETGLLVEPEQLTGIYKNMTRGVVALVFRCKITGGQLTTTDEAVAFQWASTAEVSALVRTVYAIRILDALSDSPPAVRAHDGTRLV